MSDQSLKLFECRYCLFQDSASNLISPCLCQGSLKYVHKTCLIAWIKLKENLDLKFQCEICKNYIKLRLIYKNSILKAVLLMIKSLQSPVNIIQLTFKLLIIILLIKRLNLFLDDMVYMYLSKRNLFTKFRYYFNNIYIFITSAFLINDIIGSFYSNFYFYREVTFEIEEKVGFNEKLN